MMQEEELVIKDRYSERHHGHSENQNLNNAQDILPFTISDGIYDDSERKYSITLFEIFVTVVVMLSTISGGYLEGYMSPALPSLIKPVVMTESVELNFASSDATNPVEATEETVSAFDVNTTEISPFSMDNNETTNILELLPTPLPLLNSSDEGSWLGSLLLLGAALGSAVSPWVIKYGRRHAIIASGAPRLLGWLLTIFSTSVYTFYIGRFVCGISIGAISAAIPIYISEVAHPSLRGTLSCIIILGVNFGMFIAAFFGTFLDWNGLAVLGAFFVVAYFVPSFCIPNSPSWLALQGKEEDARNSLRRLRRKGWPIEDELQQILTIAEKVSREKSIPWKCLFVEKRSLLPLVVVTLVTVVNRFSGYNAIITYCSIFIREAVPSASEYWSNVAICLVQLESSVGIIGICLVYASVCLIGGGTLFFLVPETKGKSLAEIEAHFSSPQKGLFPSIRKFDRNLSSILDQEAATIDTYSTFH
ncbi:Facilitated trehalose transporter Tret1 [Armadillidium vulgare]|nr:Facilitated trehalose transporter Tret1 [Armadillidium vulgare]